MFDVIGKRRWFFLFSLLITIPGFIFIVLTPLTHGAVGLQFSIDYTGGTNWEIRFKDPNVTADRIKSVLAGQAGVGDADVVATSDGYYQIRTRDVALPEVAVPTSTPAPAPSESAGASASASASAGASPSSSASASAGPSASPGSSAATSPSPSPSASAAASPSPSPSPTPVPGKPDLPTSGPMVKLVDALQGSLGPISDQRSLYTVGPVVSSELTQQAILLVILGSLGILIWMTIRFRDVRFGATALVALFHDVIVVVGSFAVLGTLFHVQVDALFVTAMLTVIGFSVHDTIVVYDRIRENRARHAGEPFDRIVNHSILQTFGRSINTSMTVVVTLMALLLFGGAATTYFVLALLIGIVSGTYSSIFNASPLLVVWHEWDERRKARAAVALGRTGRRPAG